MKNLIFVFALILVSFAAAAAQSPKVTVKSYPKCDTLDVSRLGTNIEIIETVETFSRLEIETSINPNLGETTAKTIHGVLGVQHSEDYNTKTVRVSPVKSDDLFSVSVGGNDIELKRSYKLYVPQGTTVKR